MNQGWIGTWSPGIGDPTIGGWVTVALYAWCAWACLRVLRRARRGRIFLNDNERVIWRLLMVGMIALGINKQLDLQSAMTELARILAFQQGWYENRRQYQEAFIAAVPVVGLTILAAISLLVWNAHAATRWACAGAAALVIFVAVRAVSFHHVDEMLGWRMGGVPLNWVLEMGSLLVIGWGAHTRASTPARI